MGVSLFVASWSSALAPSLPVSVPPKGAPAIFRWVHVHQCSSEGHTVQFKEVIMMIYPSEGQEIHHLCCFLRSSDHCLRTSCKNKLPHLVRSLHTSISNPRQMDLKKQGSSEKLINQACEKLWRQSAFPLVVSLSMPNQK